MSAEWTEDFAVCVASTRQVLHDFGADNWIPWLDSQVKRQHRQRPLVVVAGETKRGKSAFVNALVKRPGLSPSGDDNVTNVYMSIVGGAEDQVFVYFQSDQKEPIEVAPAEFVEVVDGTRESWQ